MSTMEDHANAELRELDSTTLAKVISDYFNTRLFTFIGISRWSDITVCL